MNLIIKAEVHSDDYAVEIVFDAVSWFKQASRKEIIELVKCGFGGDYPADYVAEFYEKNQTKDLFQYLHILNKEPNFECGFECHVDQDPALRWLRKNRPKIYKELVDSVLDLYNLPPRNLLHSD